MITWNGRHLTPPRNPRNLKIQLNNEGSGITDQETNQKMVYGTQNPGGKQPPLTLRENPLGKYP